MDPRSVARSRLNEERGTSRKQAPERVALCYPSPYRVGMSSLGFQTIYREINSRPAAAADRAFLPDPEEIEIYRRTHTPVFTYEAERPISDYPVIAISVAYEMEIAGVIELLELSGIPALAEERDARHPFVLCGGPLTNSNPLPLAPFADAIVMGEADQAIHRVLDCLFNTSGRDAALRELAGLCYVPSIHGESLPTIERADDLLLPAWAPIRTPNTELADMFLLEVERGCSRGCQYCVMRRSTNGGMRIVPVERIFSLIPDDARKVGLVGAAVSDHPKIVQIVSDLASQGRQVSLSSLRPDRLTDAFIGALKQAGARALTTALDAPSQRLRDRIDRKAKEIHFLRIAERVKAHALHHLKVYMMVGLPDETDADIDELIAFATELSTIHPLVIGISPFVAKRNTPLDGVEFAGIQVVDDRLDRLRRGLRGRVELRSTSARWAYVEYVLAQGSWAEGRAVLDAVHAGGRFSAYKKAFSALPAARTRRPLRVVS